MKPKVALTKGGTRRKNIYNSLQLIESEIKDKLSNKTVLLKPNMVSDNLQKAATHINHLRGILDFLSQFYKGEIIIAEGSAANTERGFKNYGYYNLKKEYDFNFKFIDLNKDEGKEIKLCRDRKIKFSKTILNSNYFIISAAKLKTHDTVIATLSIKNLLMGAVVGKDKTKVHQGIKEINKNLLTLAQKRLPDLASIGAFFGMEGNGPTHGKEVKLKTALASLDPLAADRIGLEIMRINPENVGYLFFCDKENLGEYNLEKIKIVGEKLQECIFKKPFKLHSGINRQLKWKEINEN